MKNTPFNELLKSPHLLASMPIEELEDITKNYPWFSLAHSYLAKAYQENKSHKTSGQIALASTLHSNRTWLYGFLKEPILQKQTPTEIADTLPTETITETVVEVTPSAAAPSNTLAQLAASMMDEEPEVREVKRGEEPEVREDKRGEEPEVREVKRGEEPEAREDKRGEEPEVREDKRGEEKGTQEEEEVTDLDFLDKSILATAVASSIFLEVSETEEEKEEDDDDELDVERDSSKDAIQDSAKDATQGPAEEGENEALFTWLRSVSDVEGETLQETSESVQPALDLIEKFIATEPRITPGKVEQYTGVSFAKDSLEENFDWVTETMAKLYATQGKIDRARKAYKRLIELHPEKKIHFENQLKALNQRK
jgi:tetratricopeptide (TPR) repeat protein